MRKHRLSGVVIAVLIGLGTFTHRSDSPHRTPGTDRAGIQLTSATLPAGRGVAPVVTTVAVEPTAELHAGLLHQLGGRSATALALPFSPQVLVQDVGVVQLAERAQAQAYFTVLAQRHAALRAYLASLPRPHPAPPVTAARAAAPPPAPAPAGRDPFAALRQCESGGNYGTDTGNGYYGAYQFTAGTWRSLGLGGLPSQAPPAVQDRAARALQARRGWGPWPSCARRLGLL
jgi:hypothetical protein